MITNYNSLSIGKYIRLCDTLADNSLDELGKQVTTLSILADKTEDEILYLPLLEYQEMARQAKFLECEPPMDNAKIGKTYKIGKWTLCPVTFIGKITTAQYIDFQTLSQDALHHLAEVVSCFLIPEGCKYNDGYDIAELQADIRNLLSVAQANALIAFFLRKFNLSMRSILLYSAIQARRIKDKEMRKTMRASIAQAEMSLRRDGDGWQMLMQLQRPAVALGIQSGI